MKIKSKNGKTQKEYSFAIVERLVGAYSVLISSTLSSLVTHSFE